MEKYTKLKENSEKDSKIQIIKNGKKSKTGITLIALVITIIVLLILAGVSIMMLAGDNSILRKAAEAKEITGDAAIEEAIKMAYNNAVMKKYTNGSADFVNDMKEELEKTYGTVQIIESNGTYTVTINEKEYTVGETELPIATGTTPYLPSSSFNQVAGTNLSTGLVIRDSVGNEYVWIEVPNYYDETTATWIGPDYSSIENSADYDNIESALQAYASKYRDSSYNDVWYDGNGYPATEIPSSGSASDSASGSETTISSDLEDTSGCGLTYVQYTTLKNKMLTSIYENGGFWIGRYEAGISEPRTEHSDVTTSTTIKAVSQPNQYPLNYVKCSEAQILASKVATDAGLEDYTSSLMFGIQWDLVMTYLENKGISYDDLATDSTSWGNYYNNKWTITNTNAKYYTFSNGWKNGAYGTKSSNSKILLSTGADSSFSKMNIFDLAGNVFEFTLERYNYSSSPCTGRGGYYGYYGSDHSASDRGDVTTGYYGDVGFRVSLY